MSEVALCKQCGKPVLKNKIFCSVSCKSESQKKRILINCYGCGKEFDTYPYLKRTTNYCSRVCYRNSTRVKEKRLCQLCGRKFVATGTLIRKGFGIYCSRKCQFRDYPQKVEKVCLMCNKHFFVWPSHSGFSKFCSKKCSDDSKRDYVSRICRKCKKKFDLPRSDVNRGRGNFCTYKCFLKYRGPSTLEEKMERALSLAGIKFQREVKFKRFHADFLIEDKKTIIECDGEYWHMNSKIQQRDKRKEKLLNRLGYIVFRFSGTSIAKFSDDVLATKVKDMIGKVLPVSSS